MRKRVLPAACFLLFAAGVGVAACASETSPSPGKDSVKSLSREAMLDAASCQGCHPTHYAEWSGSMHAYASDDPVFIAMNKRMQRETNGQLGAFCVRCHAPMAVREGKTTDGLNLATLPKALKGVTCFFCHTVDAVTDSHNNPLELTSSPVMGAAISDPLPNNGHASKYARFVDGKNDVSPAMCGACHDIVTPGGASIERTLSEWAQSRYAGVGVETAVTCGDCHMPARRGVAAKVDGAPMRTLHDHSLPGADLALTSFPMQDSQLAGVRRLLDSAIDTRLCVTPKDLGVELEAVLINRKVGHGFPSGSNQDRRAWAQVTAYKDGAVVFESGRVPDQSSVADSAKLDPSLFLLRDHLYDAAGAETDLFWRAVRFEGKQVPAQTTSDPARPDYDVGLHQHYSVSNVVPDRVDLVVKMRPMDFDTLHTMVDSGDLDPKFAANVHTYTLAGSAIQWKKNDGAPCVTSSPR